MCGCDFSPCGLPWVPGQGVADSAHLRGITSGHSGLSHALYCRWDQASVCLRQLHLSFSLTSFPFSIFLSLSPTIPPHSHQHSRYLGLHWLMDCSLLPNSLGCGPLRHVIWGTSGNASTPSSYCVTCGRSTRVMNNYVILHAPLTEFLVFYCIYLNRSLLIFSSCRVMLSDVLFAILPSLLFIKCFPFA